jgi:hypothetical protein
MSDLATKSPLVITVGVCFLVYGVLKLVLFLLMRFLPSDKQDKLSKLPLMKWLFTGDHTLAGKWAEYVLAVFALFSIIHGMAILDAFPPNVCDVIESRPFQYTFYILCGMSTVIFYAIVQHTDVDISKEADNREIYNMYGWIGWSFLLVPVVWELTLIAHPYVQQMTYQEHIIFMTVCMAAFVLVISAVIISIKR